MDSAIPSTKLGFLIDQLSGERLRKAALEAQVDVHEKRIALLEAQIIELMQEQKLERCAHGGIQVAPKDHVYAHVESWEKFYEFIEREKYWHLLEKRVSVTGYRELLDLGREVPGVVPFHKLKLSVTKSAR